MSAMTTTLIQFADQGNSRTYTRAGHTYDKPKLVLQRRKIPNGKSTVAEDTITVLNGTVDPDGKALPERVSLSLTVRRPLNGADADVTDALTMLREIVASDNLANMIATQNFVQ